MSWSPFDCLAVAGQTGSGLLQRDATEVELLSSTEPVELRAATNDEPMVPMNAQNNGVDETKRASDWVDRVEIYRITVTTHRLVFYKDADLKQTAPRYLHLCNVFNVSTETFYFKSPKIVLNTAIGDLLLCFKSSKQRDELLKQIELSLSRKQYQVETERQNQEVMRRKTNRKVGVDAVLSSAATKHKHAAEITDTAFTGDAETLLKEAADLVQIIQKYVATLDRNENTNDDNDTDKLVNLLSDMGMTSVLQKADYKGRAEEAYYDQTARQLVDFLKPKLVNQPVMTLTDVYCLFNRARGSHLLSPEDLLRAVERLQDLHLGLELHTFPDSGLMVVQDTERTSNDMLAEQFLQLAESATGFVTALTVSQHFHVSAVLAHEQLLAACRSEHLVIDETLESVRFYPNKFRQWAA